MLSLLDMLSVGVTVGVAVVVFVIDGCVVSWDVGGDDGGLQINKCNVLPFALSNKYSDDDRNKI